jgi:dipeptidyl aminopeptidase/acylaminoacyl peptidase
MKREPTPPQRHLTSRALLETKRLSDLQVHPDGNRIAFVVAENNFADSETVSHLWLTEYVAPDSEEPKPQEPAEPEDWTRQLTYSAEGESCPRWSPDGEGLAFLSSRPDPQADEEEETPDTPQVWLLPMEGGEARKLTSTREPILQYTWLPDSSAILYLTPQPLPKPLESTRKDEQNSLFIDPVREPLERHRRQLWQITLEAEKPTLLCTLPLGTDEFALSPDGKRVAFSTNYTGEPDQHHEVDIYILELTATAKPFKLVQRRGGKSDLCWSPDGTHLSFVSCFMPEIAFSRDTLFLAEVPQSVPEGFVGEMSPTAEGVSVAQILPQPDSDVMDYVWNGDAVVLFALVAEGTETHLYRLSPEKEPECLTKGVCGERTSLAQSYDGAILAWVMESDTALQEVQRFDLQTPPTNLTQLHSEFAQHFRLPRFELVRWTAPDGLQIEGILVTPLDYSPDKAYPLLVQVHGGPKGRVTRTLRNYYHSAVWATEGYAVLLPNFRGSEGYGNAFAIANRQDIGGGDFEDIMAGVDYCIARGIADPERLGIMGGSYGGFMTNWAIGHTARFRAAISLFGIFHLQTDFSNSDFPSWEYDYLGGWYWENPEIYRRLSPGTYLQNIQTPTLILHGEDDNNTFISNSKEMYQALRQRGVSVEFVHYPREGHGVREPNHKLDEMRRCLAWMDRYLRGGVEGREGVYRLRDQVPNPAGTLELCLLRVESESYMGFPRNENTLRLWEVEFTIHRKEPDVTALPLQFSLTGVRLERYSVPEESFSPLGIPLKVQGGRVLVEGESLHFTVAPDPQTGEQAFGGVVVFALPKQESEYWLRVSDFPPIRVHTSITLEQEKEEAQEEREG